MFKNYLRTAWRSIQRNRIYSTINIVGLTIGLAACMIVITVVIDDLSYDRQWSRGKDIYRIVTVNNMGQGLNDRFASSPTGLGNVLRNDFPEVQTVAELSVGDQTQFRLNKNDETGIKVKALYADTSVWQMLDLKVLSGYPRHYTDGVSNLIVSESFKKKYFPNENPVGKTIYNVPIYNDKQQNYLITGLIADIPSNTVLRSELIILQKPHNEELNKKQYGSYSQNYILLKPGTDIKSFTQKVNHWYSTYVEVKNPYRFEFQPMQDIYLHSSFAETLSVKGDYKSIFILLGVGVLLLLIACVNFINLTSARAIYRRKETGVRKILGANRNQLVIQFLIEAILFFSISTMLAFIIYSLVLPGVEDFLGHALAIALFSSFSFSAAVISVIVALSILIGLYPSLLMSGFKPAAALKGNLFSGGTASQNFVRKSLVVFQFSLSIIVLIALIVVQQQVDFFKTKDIGFNKDHLLYTQWINMNDRGEALKNEMLRQPGVESVSLTAWTPASKGYMTRDVPVPGKEEKIKVWYITGDVDLARTLELRLKKGRFLSNTFGFDAMNDDDLQEMDSAQYARTAVLQSSLITEYTAKVLNIIELNHPSSLIKNTPVGIIEDFTPESLKSEMNPTVILAEKDIKYGGMLVRTAPGKDRQVAMAAHQLLRKFYPEKSLDIKWVDEMIAQQYEPEEKLQKLFAFFSSLSMFLAALGILGLVVQATSQRVKEIGIRKVLGASVNSIVRLFSLDFIKLIFISLLIASPLAWWLMNKWLMDYAYRITIHWWIFGIAGLIAMVIALVTISFQAIKAAKANPVESLRTE